MNGRQLLLRMVFLVLVAWLLGGCAGVQAEPTGTPTLIPPTPTGTPLPVPPTPTTVPPTPTSQTADASTDYYRFQLGEFECVCLYDGSHNYALNDFFPGVPLEQIQEALRQHNLSVYYARTPYTQLYVNTGEHQVLVDMGAGRELANTGKLPQSMHTAGIDPAQIDTVIITHAHPDHIGGALDKEGKPVYASASYYISRDEWSFWFSEDAMAKADPMLVRTAKRNLEPIRDRVNLVEGESEITPGIHVIPAPGHTPGHIVVQVESGGQRLYFIADTVLHPLHLEHPDWVPVFDMLPEKAATSKRAILDLAADEQAPVIGQHFPPFPSLGYVVKTGEGWGWQPIGTTSK